VSYTLDHAALLARQLEELAPWTHEHDTIGDTFAGQGMRPPARHGPMRWALVALTLAACGERRAILYERHHDAARAVEAKLEQIAEALPPEWTQVGSPRLALAVRPMLRRYPNDDDNNVELLPSENLTRLGQRDAPLLEHGLPEGRLARTLRNILTEKWDGSARLDKDELTRYDADLRRALSTRYVVVYREINRVLPEVDPARKTFVAGTLRFDVTLADLHTGAILAVWPPQEARIDARSVTYAINPLAPTQDAVAEALHAQQLAAVQKQIGQLLTQATGGVFELDAPVRRAAAR
jgi:hypothetical protein